MRDHSSNTTHSFFLAHHLGSQSCSSFNSPNPKSTFTFTRLSSQWAVAVTTLPPPPLKPTAPERLLPSRPSRPGAAAQPNQFNRHWAHRWSPWPDEAVTTETNRGILGLLVILPCLPVTLSAYDLCAPAFPLHLWPACSPPSSTSCLYESVDAHVATLFIRYPLR